MKYPLSVIVFAAISSISVASANEIEWEYDGNTGPDHWAELDESFAACAGKQQSPVDIIPDRAVEAELLPLEINWNEQVDLSVANTGHNIQNNGADLGSATINGKEYTLKQFHFHHPSEHTINGKSFPAEVHFVHESADGALAVIAVMLEGGGENPLFDHSLNAAPKSKGEAYLGKENPRNLLPEDLSVYTYQGSLTTPPCSEIVDWNILQTPVKAMDAGIEAFAELYENDARPAQDIERRYILK